MNYIKQLQTENQELKNEILAIQSELTDAIKYYHLDKFKGIDNDYAHVSTDVLPRLMQILNAIKTN